MREGFVTTLFGRKCRLPGINDRNPARRAFQERAAINAPIQGAAADVIKRAMIPMQGALEALRPAGPDAAPGARRAGVRGARGGSR